MFRSAQWVCAGNYDGFSNRGSNENGVPIFPVLRGKFYTKSGDCVCLRVVGLGFFHCYVNGREVTDQKYLPLSTDYEPRENYPTYEILFGHRLYVPEFDITPFVNEGENTIAIHFGGGWYTFEYGGYGFPKAIYAVKAENGTDIRYFGSSPADKIGDSFIKSYCLINHENHDYRNFDDRCLGTGFDDSGWDHAVLADAPDTEYLQTDCPADVEAESVPFEFVGEKNGEKIYRCEKNISGYPVVKVYAGAGEKVQISFDETINADGSFTDKADAHFSFMQTMEIISDGKERAVVPLFTWFGFQYFKIKGDAVPERVVFVHANVEKTSDIICNNETLNWIYRAFVNTQLSNMHAGIPSDCPHYERRGYTGDGQLCAPAVMKTIGAKAFYAKWIEDISDSQDRLSGHCQYVVPYAACGGGPGGWGCAIVEVPYQFFKHYGEIAPFKKLYPQMLHWFEYLEAHSENDIIVSDKEGEWCLGEWVTPDPVQLPTGLVNNYFYIRSMRRCLEMLPLIGHTEDGAMLTDRIKRRENAINTAYFNENTGNYTPGAQGADAFAVDIGLGNEKTYRSLTEQYQNRKAFDTGIFGTEILTRVLFEHGDADLALELLTDDSATSFEAMRRAGMLTLWENWPSSTFQRSYNHPMFGAVVSHFFTYLLGIRQEPGQGGYGKITVSPCLCKGLDHVSGFITTPRGRLSVNYEKGQDSIRFSIEIPTETEAVFCLNGRTEKLHTGTNLFDIPLV